MNIKALNCIPCMMFDKAVYILANKLFTLNKDHYNYK